MLIFKYVNKKTPIDGGQNSSTHRSPKYLLNISSFEAVGLEIAKT